MAGAYFVPGQSSATYDYTPSGEAYNPLSAYYGYGYNTYINSVAGTSPFFSSFLASTGYAGGSASLGGYDITGSFADISGGPFFDLSGPIFPGAQSRDLGGAILGPAMAGGVLTSYPTAWEMYALSGLDVPPLAASAIAGASYAESGGWPGRAWTGFQNHAFGSFQWLNAGRAPGGRQDNLFDWAEEIGLAPDSFEAQSTFVMNEFGTVFANNSRLFSLYDPYNTQAQHALNFVRQYLGPARGFEENRDVRIASNWPNVSSGITPTAAPLFTLVPLPDFSE